MEIDVCGNLTLMTVAQHEKAVVAALTDSDDDVLLDLTYVTSTSATGLHMVQYLQTLLAGHGRELFVVATRLDVLRRLDDVGLLAFVSVFASRELARSHHSWQLRAASEKSRAIAM